MIKKEIPPRGSYICYCLERYLRNGDAYIPMDDIYPLCAKERPNLGYSTFRLDLAEQIRLGKLSREGSRLYFSKTLRYENAAAQCLAHILPYNDLPTPALPSVMTAAEGFTLSSEQQDAVKLALSNRLSLILGGAGCGKSTLIRAIVNVSGTKRPTVLCAPTGKAARNLTKRTGLIARTVHSALGMHPNEDFLAPVVWNTTELVIVDEASMMTLEMLAGILHRVPKFCRVVLLGDPNQLLSVGSGNVLPDLLALGVPCAHLELNHRQNEGARGLLHNVVEFSKLHRQQDLVTDESFSLREMGESAVQKALTEEAVCRFLSGESVQVLSPYNTAGKLSVRFLNQMIRDRVNPLEPGKPVLTGPSGSFRDGDRVIILQNDREKDCSNGDVGILHIQRADSQGVAFLVELPDGRCPAWDNIGGLEMLSLAYVLTVHKSQGSEYDTVLLPVTMGLQSMLSRNLFYTAISRARQKMILFGEPQAVDVATQKPLPRRKSMLAPKTRMLLENVRVTTECSS